MTTSASSIFLTLLPALWLGTFGAAGRRVPLSPAAAAFAAVPLIEHADNSSRFGTCHVNLLPLWSVEVGSGSAGVFAAPAVGDLIGNGKQQIILSTAGPAVEALEGDDAADVSGWPLSVPGLRSISSPILYDVDHDGTSEVIVASIDAQFLVINSRGVPLYDYQLRVPLLPILARWFEDLQSVSPSNDSDRISMLANNWKLGNPATNESSSTVDPLQAIKKIIDRSRLLYEQNGNDEEEDDEEEDEYIDDTNSDINDADSNSNFNQGDGARRKKKLVLDYNYVLVDPHVLATPVLEDLDGDDNDELIIPVSFFFDGPDYVNDISRSVMEKANTSLQQYAACAIIIFDLLLFRIKKTIDINTTNNTHSAHLLTSPSVADIDRDGIPEIIIGSSVGVVYALTPDGESLPGFPILTEPVNSQIFVTDIRGDGKLYLIVADEGGNLVAYDKNGVEVWENRFTPSAPEMLTCGDINNDGVLDIVFATTSGFLWAFRGDTGIGLPGFPFELSGSFLAPVLLGKVLNTHALQIVAPSTTGTLYILDSSNFCISKIDLNERVVAAPMFGDFIGDNSMQIILATTTGHVHCLGSNMTYHPLKTSWSADSRPQITLPYRESYMGVYFQPSTRQMGAISGHLFTVEFYIHDVRPVLKNIINYSPKYSVRILFGNKKVLYSATFDTAGSITASIPVPPVSVQVGHIMIELRNELRERFQDSFDVSINMHFYRVLKWIVILSVTFMTAVVLVINNPSTF